MGDKRDEGKERKKEKEEKKKEEEENETQIGRHIDRSIGER